MVVGSDMKGIATELEARTGLPGFGFDTTGTAYYDRGVSAALIALLERFAEPSPSVPNTVSSSIPSQSSFIFSHNSLNVSVI